MELYLSITIFGMLNLVAVLAVRYIRSLASPVFLLLAPVSLFTGSMDGMTVLFSLVFYFYSFVCLALAIITQFRRADESY